MMFVVLAKFGAPVAAGYADGQPLAGNDSEEGKAMNRRVEIVLTNLKVAHKK